MARVKLASLYIRSSATNATLRPTASATTNAVALSDHDARPSAVEVLAEPRQFDAGRMRDGPVCDSDNPLCLRMIHDFLKPARG